MKYPGTGISHVYALSNGLLLSIESSHETKITTLTLFNPKTAKKIVERLIATYWAKAIPLDDNIFLLEIDHDDKLYILSSDNLEIREVLHENISNFGTGYPIGNNRFLSIHEQKNKKHTQLTLVSHNCKTKQFNQKVSHSFLIKHEGSEYTYTSDLKKCTKNILLAIDFSCVADYRKEVTTLLSQSIGRDPGSIVNGYLGHDGLWVKDETPSNPKASKIGQCIIS